MDKYFIIIFCVFFISLVINMVTLNYLVSKFSNIINFNSLEYLLTSAYPFHTSFYLFQKDFPQKRKLLIFFKVAYLVYVILGYVVVVYLFSKFIFMILKFINTNTIWYTIISELLNSILFIVIAVGIFASTISLLIYFLFFFKLSRLNKMKIESQFIDQIIPFYKFNIYYYLYIKENPDKKKQLLLHRLNILFLKFIIFFISVLIFIKFIH